MRIETTVALLSSIALTILLKRLNMFCDDNNILRGDGPPEQISIKKKLSHIIILNAPKVDPINITEHTVKLSKYAVLGKLPIKTHYIGPIRVT